MPVARATHAGGLVSMIFDSAGDLFFGTSNAGSSPDAIFSEPTGTYTGVQTVTLTDSTPGVAIYYTTVGSDPSQNFTLYTGPIMVSASVTLRAMALASNYLPSGIVTVMYTINPAPAATPTFSPAPDTYTSVQSVSLADATPGATIYYTTDGSTPTTSSTTYSGPISVSTTTTINAIAVAAHYGSSAMMSGTFTLNLPPPNFTVADSSNALTINPSQQGITTVEVTPQNGFSGNVSFACAGLPANTNCAFSPKTVTPNGGTAITQLTVTTVTPARASFRFTTTSLLRGSTLAFAVCLLGWRKRRGSSSWPWFSSRFAEQACSSVAPPAPPRPPRPSPSRPARKRCRPPQQFSSPFSISPLHATAWKADRLLLSARFNSSIAIRDGLPG